MEGSSSSRKLTMKLVTRILDRRVAKWTPIPCTSGIIRGNKVKIDVCILMPYITWPTLGYIIICSYFLPMIPLYAFLILVWCMSSQFFLTAANFSIPALSLKIKCNVLHVQNRDIKEASSVFWWRGITRTQENCCTVWGKDLYCRHQSGIRLMLGSIILIFSRHEYTHA